MSVTERVDGIGLTRNKYSKYNNPYFNQIGEGERERERQRQRQRQRQRHRQTDRQTDRQRERQRRRQNRDRDRDRQSSITNLPWVTFTFY